MVTRAQITADGRSATLTQNGKHLTARLLSPANTKFESIPADPPKDNFNAPNPDARILIVNAAAPEARPRRMNRFPRSRSINGRVHGK